MRAASQPGGGRAKLRQCVISLACSRLLRKTRKAVGDVFEHACRSEDVKPAAGLVAGRGDAIAAVQQDKTGAPRPNGPRG